MEENIVITPGGESAPKMTGFKSVCLKLGLMMVIIFVSRGAENVLLSLALSSGLFAEMDGNTAYLIQTAVSFLFLYIIPMICAALLLKPEGMCAEVFKKPVYFSNAMGMFPAMYGLSFLVNLLTMLASNLFRNTDLYKSFNTVNELRPDNMFCAVVLLVQLVVVPGDSAAVAETLRQRVCDICFGAAFRAYPCEFQPVLLCVGAGYLPWIYRGFHKVDNHHHRNARHVQRYVGDNAPADNL